MKPAHLLQMPSLFTWVKEAEVDPQHHTKGSVFALLGQNALQNASAQMRADIQLWRNEDTPNITVTKPCYYNVLVYMTACPSERAAHPSCPRFVCLSWHTWTLYKDWKVNGFQRSQKSIRQNCFIQHWCWLPCAEKKDEITAVQFQTSALREKVFISFFYLPGS